jgi:predicted Holliday junction resolvase-like endonuclease
MITFVIEFIVTFVVSAVVINAIDAVSGSKRRHEARWRAMEARWRRADELEAERRQRNDRKRGRV